MSRRCSNGVVGLAPLRHRVEAERRLALGRELRIQAVLQHVLGEPLGVLADLGDRQVAVDDVEPGALHRRLQLAQGAHILAERHHCQVGLVTEDRRRDDLQLARARLLVFPA